MQELRNNGIGFKNLYFCHVLEICFAETVVKKSLQSR